MKKYVEYYYRKGTEEQINNYYCKVMSADELEILKQNENIVIKLVTSYNY